jgi:hypothetical protein
LYPVEDHSNWMEFYTDDSEEILKDLPLEKGTRVRITVYVDALSKRISITGIPVMLIKLLLYGYSSVRR